jgi:hypothetical protein
VLLSLCYRCRYHMVVPSPVVSLSCLVDAVGGGIGVVIVCPHACNCGLCWCCCWFHGCQPDVMVLLMVSASRLLLPMRLHAMLLLLVLLLSPLSLLLLVMPPLPLL